MISAAKAISIDITMGQIHPQFLHSATFDRNLCICAGRGSCCQGSRQQHGSLRGPTSCGGVKGQEQNVSRCQTAAMGQVGSRDSRPHSWSQAVRPAAMPASCWDLQPAEPGATWLTAPDVFMQPGSLMHPDSHHFLQPGDVMAALTMSLPHHLFHSTHNQQGVVQQLITGCCGCDSAAGWERLTQQRRQLARTMLLLEPSAAPQLAATSHCLRRCRHCRSVNRVSIRTVS